MCPCNRYATSTRSRATGRMTRIRQWNFAMSNLENSFNDWKLEIAMHDSEQEVPLPGNVKTGIIFSNARGDIYKHLLSNTGVATPYTNSRDILTTYFSSCGAVRDVQSYSRWSTPNNGPDPMAIDDIWRSLRKGCEKYSKGKYTCDYKSTRTHFYNQVSN